MNKFQQIKVLGEGGYGKAILARQRSDNKMCVIKEVRLSALSPKDRNEATKEAKVLASLKHPNIVNYISSFQERGCFYIVMEYADGGDLSDKIEKRGKRPFSEDEILHYFIQISLAIKYIHDRKILHRDLKTQNVFLTKDNTVKLGDFGIARVLEHTFQLCRTQIGTPYYLSPEICEGKNYNSKTDIWSLGCILYELCTLKHAFQGGNMKGLMMNIVGGKFAPIPSTYSKDLSNLVNEILTKEPSKRPTINDILGKTFIKQRLSSLLEKTILDYEFSHTILHGRKPFAAPTVVINKNDMPQNLIEEKNNENNNNLVNDNNNKNMNNNQNNNNKNMNNKIERSPSEQRYIDQKYLRQQQQKQYQQQQQQNYNCNIDPRYAKKNMNNDNNLEVNGNGNNNNLEDDRRKKYNEDRRKLEEVERQRQIDELKRRQKEDEDLQRKMREGEEKMREQKELQELKELKELREKREREENERKRKLALEEQRNNQKELEMKRIALERERQKRRFEQQQKELEEMRRLAEEQRREEEEKRKKVKEMQKAEEEWKQKRDAERRQHLLDIEEERKEAEELEKQRLIEVEKKKKERDEMVKKRQLEADELKKQQEQRRLERMKEQQREKEELEAERLRIIEEEKEQRRKRMQQQREIREQQKRDEEERRKKQLIDFKQNVEINNNNNSNINNSNNNDHQQPNADLIRQQLFKEQQNQLRNNKNRGINGGGSSSSSSSPPSSRNETFPDKHDNQNNNDKKVEFTSSDDDEDDFPADFEIKVSNQNPNNNKNFNLLDQTTTDEFIHKIAKDEPAWARRPQKRIVVSIEQTLKSPSNATQQQHLNVIDKDKQVILDQIKDLDNKEKEENNKADDENDLLSSVQSKDFFESIKKINHKRATSVDPPECIKNGNEETLGFTFIDDSKRPSWAKAAKKQKPVQIHESFVMDNKNEETIKNHGEIEIKRSKSETKPTKTSKRLLPKHIIEPDNSISEAENENNLEDFHEINNDEENEEELADAKLSALHDLAMSIKEALSLKPSDLAVDDGKNEKKSNKLNGTIKKEKPTEQTFYINDQEVKFPVARDSESRGKRSESIKTFLEKNIGVETLIALNEELISKEAEDNSPTPIISDLPPGIVYLAQQLLMLDATIKDQ